MEEIDWQYIWKSEQEKYFTVFLQDYSRKERYTGDVKTTINAMQRAWLYILPNEEQMQQFIMRRAITNSI